MIPFPSVIVQCYVHFSCLKASNTQNFKIIANLPEWSVPILRIRWAPHVQMGPFLRRYSVKLTDADVQNVQSCSAAPLWAIMALSGHFYLNLPANLLSRQNWYYPFYLYLPVLSAIRLIICISFFVRIASRKSVTVFCLIQDLVLLVVFLYAHALSLQDRLLWCFK